MPKLTVTAASLRRALAAVAPVANRCPREIPTLRRVQVFVDGGQVTLGATDRYVIVMSDLNVQEMTDKRRVHVALDTDQVKVLRSVLSTYPSGMTTVVLNVSNDYVSISDEHIPLKLKTYPGDEQIKIRPLLEDAFTRIHRQDPVEANAFNPHLVSHIPHVQIISAAGHAKPQVFETSMEDTWGIIMPIRLSIDTLPDKAGTYLQRSIFDNEPTPATTDDTDVAPGTADGRAGAPRHD